MKSPKKAEQKSGSAATASKTGNDKNDDATTKEIVDAVTLIKNDHRKVEALFEQFERAVSPDEKAEIAMQVCTELIVHAMIEEELLYPACREADVEDDMLDEAQVEHDGAKILISDVMMGSRSDEFYDAKVKVLSEYIRHHVAEEEEPDDGILAKAQAANIDMNALGQKLQKRKVELMQQAESEGLDPPVPKSLHTHPQQHGESPQEDVRMDRYTSADRDERGRFVSDDDGERRYSRSERDDDNRRYDRARDERGRFESDDNRGSYARDRDDDDRRRSSRSRDDDHDNGRRSGRGQGWYGDSEGHREAAMRGRGDDRQSYRSRGRDDDDYDDRRGSRSRDDDDYRSGGGGRGWSGDSEGHAEAARRGWEHRGSSRRSSRPDDDYDDDRRGGSGSRGEEGHGGWFGDSRGHAEAARRGWEERSSGSRMTGSRSRRDDDDDRRGSRSRDDEGHGGWFGDSRGHEEAARRGWQNRDREWPRGD